MSRDKTKCGKVQGLERERAVKAWAGKGVAPGFPLLQAQRFGSCLSRSLLGSLEKLAMQR